jgi:hypothetical protein
MVITSASARERAALQSDLRSAFVINLILDLLPFDNFMQLSPSEGHNSMLLES